MEGGINQGIYMPMNTNNSLGKAWETPVWGGGVQWENKQTNKSKTKGVSVILSNNKDK